MKLILQCKALLLCLFLCVGCSLIAQPHYPNAVVSFSQGLRVLGNPVAAARSNPSKALGAPENSDAQGGTINYVSLGFGGSITLAFPQPIPVTFRTKAFLVETTYSYQCSQYPETADLYVSSNGSDFFYAGSACVNSGNTIELYTVIDTVRYVRVVDASPQSGFQSFNDADAFDLDGLEIFEMYPLAIELGEFVVKQRDSQAHATFTTLSETNALCFYIESSNDLVNYQRVAAVQAYGYSSTLRTYEVSFNFEPTSSITYFRLSEQDGNGAITQYAIVAAYTPLKGAVPYYYYDLLGRSLSSPAGAAFRVTR